MITITHGNNMNSYSFRVANLIYCDFIYQDLDFSWAEYYWNFLIDGGIFIAQTDDSSCAELKLFLKNLPNSIWVNTCIYKQEWGGVPKKGFPQKHDYIHIYTNNKNFKWYGDRIQIPKVTAGTNLDKKGTGLKTPCSVFDDLGNFSTISKERVKNKEGKNIRWQKPLKLFDRLCLPFTDEGDYIVDPFMGSGSLGEWCALNNRDYEGIENNKDVFEISKNRLNKYNPIIVEGEF
jgi:DNA modification methylase